MGVVRVFLLAKEGGIGGECGEGLGVYFISYPPPVNERCGRVWLGIGVAYHRR